MLKENNLWEIKMMIETGFKTLCSEARLVDETYGTYGHKLIVAKSVQNTLCLQELVKDEKLIEKC